MVTTKSMLSSNGKILAEVHGAFAESGTNPAICSISIEEKRHSVLRHLKKEGVKMDNGLYVVSPNIVKADIGNMCLAYLPDKETFFVMNETAAMLLAILEQGKSKANLSKALNTLYPQIEHRVKERVIDAFIHLVLDNKIAKSSEESRVSFEKIQLPRKVAVLDTPVISVYEKKWILQQHPDAVYDPKFSDIWSPAGNGV